MPAIDQRKQLYPPRASMIEKRIERGAHGASCVENIIDKNDVPSVYIETQVAWVEDWANIFCREVIPVKADVQHAHIDWLLLDAANQRRQSSGQRNAAPLHAYQAEVVGAIILFDNLVGKPDQRPLNLSSGQDAALLAQYGLGACLCVCHKGSCGMIRGAGVAGQAIHSEHSRTRGFYGSMDGLKACGVPPGLAHPVRHQLRKKPPS